MGDVAVREDDREVALQGLSTKAVLAQVAQIQELMHAVMHKDEHYGVIPGTDKPTLYKAGAEKLCFTFRLAPERTYTWRELGGGHRECQCVSRLRHVPSGVVVGEGIGVCSTMESKYRWRNQAAMTEMGSVPKPYWDIDRNDYRTRNEAIAAVYGPGKYRAKKVDGAWVAFRVEGDGERVENPDIADTYNTVAKMATKRADVAATLTATAASDIFTQDMEDTTETEQTRTVTETAQPEPGNGGSRAEQAGDGERYGKSWAATRPGVCLRCHAEVKRGEELRYHYVVTDEGEEKRLEHVQCPDAKAELDAMGDAAQSAEDEAAWKAGGKPA